jgi:hypothetical protein
MVIVLFFQCIDALLDPINRTRGGVRWLLVIHTVVTFSFLTVHTAMNLDISTIAYVDNREYPGSGGSPVGPLGYMYRSYANAFGIVSTFMFLFNNWLADGLMVGSVPNSISQVPIIGCPSSCIVATSFME